MPRTDGGLADVVDLADDREHGAVDVATASPGRRGSRSRRVIIRLCAMNCLSSSAIAGPDQAIQPSDGQESALLLARQQRLAVVQLAQEVQPRLRGLDGVEHLEAGARQPARDVDAG